MIGVFKRDSYFFSVPRERPFFRSAKDDSYLSINAYYKEYHPENYPETIVISSIETSFSTRNMFDHGIDYLAYM